MRVFWAAVGMILIVLPAVFLPVGAMPRQNAILRRDGSSRSEPSAAAQFLTALQALSRQGKTAFVIEGEPVSYQASGKSLQARNALSMEEAVAEVGGEFGYHAERRGNLFVMTKRFTGPDDIPDITLAELRLALKAAVRTLLPYNPRIPPESAQGYPLGEGILRLLTQQQLAAMSQGGLPVASLSMAQRDEVWRIAHYFYVQNSAQIVEAVLNSIEAVARQDPMFCWRQIGGVEIFGFEIKTGTPREARFTPLSHPNQALAAGGVIITRSQTRNGIPITDDPTDPGKEIFRSEPEIAIPIEKALAELNQRSKTDALYKIDEAFAGKTVTIIGADKAAPAQMVGAIAQIYGLNTIRNTDGSLLLTRQPVSLVRNAGELGAVLRRTFPVPLLRALRGRLEAEHHGQQPAATSYGLVDCAAAADALKAAAVRRLRALVEPKMRAAKEGRIALSRLGMRAWMAFAVALGAGTLSGVAPLSEKPPPAYIAHFDRIVLTGGLYPGENGDPRFSLFFSYRDEQTGEVRRGVGFMNARLPSSVP